MRLRGAAGGGGGDKNVSTNGHISHSNANKNSLHKQRGRRVMDGNRRRNNGTTRALDTSHNITKEYEFKVFAMHTR